MKKINIITPPDKIYSQGKNILLIHPSKSLLDEFQSLLKDNDISLNVFLYQNKTDQPADVEWLLDIFHFANTVVLDCDNSSKTVRTLMSYFISHTKTFWLTNGDASVYNYISNNRVYNFDFLTNGGYFAQ